MGCKRKLLSTRRLTSRPECPPPTFGWQIAGIMDPEFSEETPSRHRRRRFAGKHRATVTSCGPAAWPSWGHSADASAGLSATTDLPAPPAVSKAPSALSLMTAIDPVPQAILEQSTVAGDCGDDGRAAKKGVLDLLEKDGRAGRSENHWGLRLRCSGSPAHSLAPKPSLPQPGEVAAKEPAAPRAKRHSSSRASRRSATCNA